MIHRQSNDLHFRQITTLLRRRWVLIATAGLLGGGLAVAAGVLLAPRYTAKAQLLYETEMQDGVAVVDNAAVETLVEMLISPNHVRRLAASLEKDPGPAVKAEAAGDAGIAATSPPPALDYEALDLGLNAYKERQSRLVAVTFTTTDPATAALVANRAVRLYLDLEAKDQRERQARALNLVAGRLPEAQAALDRAEGALRAHQIEYGLGDAAGTDVTDRQIGEMNRQRMIARSDLAARKALLERLRAASPGAGARTDAGAPPASEGVRVAATGDAAVLDEAAGGRDAGALIGAPGSAAALERVTLDYAAAEARLREIEGRLSTLRRASAEASDAWTRLQDLEREADAAGQAYESLLRRHAALLDKSGVRASARLITEASVPEAPSSPNPLLFLAPAIVAALLVGGMLAVLLERLDQRLRGERDVEEALGAPCIGLVPKVAHMQGATLRRLLRDQPFAPYTEAIRGVFVAATRRAAQGERSQSFLVTSCTGGEGKTTLAVSLAIYAAQLGRRVLVVDLDFRSPGLLRVLGEAGESGAADAQRLPWGPAPEAGIRTAKESGVDYLSLSQTGVDPLSALSGDDFPRLLSRLRQSYDVILIDSAPVIGATETQLLASMVDRVIMVVRWGVTDAHTGLAAIQQMRATDADDAVAISVVINQVKPRAHRRHRYSEPVAAPGAPQAQPA